MKWIVKITKTTMNRNREAYFCSKTELSIFLSSFAFKTEVYFRCNSSSTLEVNTMKSPTPFSFSSPQIERKTHLSAFSRNEKNSSIFV